MGGIGFWKDIFRGKGGDRQSASCAQQALWEQVQRCMEEDRPWRTPGFTLDGLSRAVHSNRTTLSRLFRSHGTSFLEDVSLRRVRFVTDRLEKEPSAPLTPLFYEAGFGSYVAGWRHFKRITGLTPKAYVQQEYGE